MTDRMKTVLFRTGLSEWTNKFIDRCEEIAGRQFDTMEIVSILDYAIGFICTKEMDNYATQTLDFLDMID